MKRSKPGKRGFQPGSRVLLAVLWHRQRLYSVVILLFLAAVLGCTPSKEESHSNAEGDSAPPHEFMFRGLVVRATDVNTQSLADWKAEGWTSVAIEVGDGVQQAKVVQAAEAIQKFDLELGYYVEVARSIEMSKAHPEWLASLQGHGEWRRLHPGFGDLEEGQVAKTWPWVPIVYRESFDGQLARVLQALSGLPAAKRIWLHDLQGGPSACGCGHPLCRWTGDYGPIHTADPMGDDAAAQFVDRISDEFSQALVIPVWATECEEQDKHDACGGVGCFKGICWKAWNRQLAPLAEACPVLGVSCFYKEHQRDLPRYGGTAKWIGEAIGYFETMPTQQDLPAVSSDRLIAVLQGWDVSANEVAAQVAQARTAKARGILLVNPRQDQSWEPRVYDPSQSSLVNQKK